MADVIGSIPIDTIVKVVPSALGTGTGVAFFNGLLLTRSDRLPVKALKMFTSAKEVASFFGSDSQEAEMAKVYFSGYEGARKLPSKLYFYGCGVAGKEGALVDLEAAMNDISSQTQDFVGFSTVWETSQDEQLVMAKWTDTQNARYWYVLWETNPDAVTEHYDGVPHQIANTVTGVTCVYKDPLVAALCLAWMASLNFDAFNGRATLGQRSNGLITPSVTDANSATNLLNNGLSFYGSFGNGLGPFNFLRDGRASGPFLWADSYINQIWLNASLQSNLLNLLLTAGQIPYTVKGDGMISAAVRDTIAQAINFGAIRAGVTLTAAQKQQIDNDAGASISDTIESNGWYFQPCASTTPATTRSARQSPPCKFWYTDGQSVQSFVLASVEVQ